ncbi:hypothetical protein [Rhodopila sp.]|uniref:hypothetical protein n=1 Tax=Rhodopila sp. TaxID=2480087 RepID=UPI003D152338
MVDDKQPNVKPVDADTPAANDTDAEHRVTRPQQGTEKVAAEADETAELGDELGGLA